MDHQCAHACSFRINHIAESPAYRKFVWAHSNSALQSSGVAWSLTIPGHSMAAISYRSKCVSKSNFMECNIDTILGKFACIDFMSIYCTRFGYVAIVAIYAECHVCTIHTTIFMFNVATHTVPRLSRQPVSMCWPVYLLSFSMRWD